MRGYNPFEVLGLPVRPDVTDDEVRSAWRAIAAKTHPDLPDGGDPARFSAAAAAYSDLRTAFGRTEAYADLTGPRPARPPARTATSPGAGSPPSTPDAAPPPSTSPGPIPPGSTQPRVLPWASAFILITRFKWRLGHGRPGVVAMRAVIAVGTVMASVAIAGWQPATLAITVGVLTWLTRTIRYDLAPV